MFSSIRRGTTTPIAPPNLKITGLFYLIVYAYCFLSYFYCLSSYCLCSVDTVLPVSLKKILKEWIQLRFLRIANCPIYRHPFWKCSNCTGVQLNLFKKNCFIQLNKTRLKYRVCRK